MPVTIRQIVQWNEGDLLNSAVTSAKKSANPRNEVDVFFMDSLAQKLRTALLATMEGTTNEDIKLFRQGLKQLTAEGDVDMARYDEIVAWLDTYAPHIKTY